MHPFHLPHFRWSDPAPSAIGLAQAAGKLRRSIRRDGIRAPIAKATRGGVMRPGPPIGIIGFGELGSVLGGPDGRERPARRPRLPPAAAGATGRATGPRGAGARRAAVGDAGGRGRRRRRGRQRRPGDGGRRGGPRVCRAARARGAVRRRQRRRAGAQGGGRRRDRRPRRHLRRRGRDGHRADERLGRADDRQRPGRAGVGAVRRRARR